MHQRLRPFQYRFSYQVVSLALDIDTFAAELDKVKCLAVDSFNFFSVHRKSFGARDGTDWRHWADKLLYEYGLTQPAKRVTLACSPRFLGYGFNPLAMWYAYDADDALVAVIAEVSNTFGHWHHYVLVDENGIDSGISATIHTQADKVFHVSPFMSMDCHYRFKIKPPAQQYAVHIAETENGEATLVATQDGERLALTTANVVKMLWRFPFNSLKVIVMIHWWAIKILLKGGKFHGTPPKQQAEKYSHSAMTIR